MSSNNVLGIIFSNAYDELLPEMTTFRTMGSVPFAGRYRLIDFPLSNMVNAGISQVGIITKANYRSLMDHVGNGKAWDLSRKREGMTILPPFNTTETGMSVGKLDALCGSIDYLSSSDKEYVLLTDCNVLGNIDYEDMINAHIEKNADITLAYTRGIPKQINYATEYEFGADGKIVSSKFIGNFTLETNYSTNVMVIRRSLLERLLQEAHSSRVENLESLIAMHLVHLKAYGYEQKGYIRVLSSLQDYYNVSLELLDRDNMKQIFAPDKPIYTKTRDEVPAFYGISSNVKNSLIADGCRIEGEVENCILFRGVTVAKGAKIKNSIIMQGSFVGENASLECVILDKSVAIKPGKNLCGASNFPVYVGKEIVI